MFEIGAVYGFSNHNVSNDVVVAVCVRKSPVRLLRLNAITSSKVSEYVSSIKQSSPMLIGGPDLADKFFYIHRFSTLSNASRIGKDLYIGGNVSEVFILDKHEKLAPSLIRFYVGCYDFDTNDINTEQFKKLGHISQADVFLPFDQIREYWEQVYANYLIDSSNLINATSISEKNLEIVSSSRSFLKSKLWIRPWLFFSILMNAISLINVGIDLKIVTPRWLSFLSFFLDFVETISRYMTYPFQLIFNIWNIQIPEIVSSTTLLTTIIIGSLRQAKNESDKFFKKEFYSVSSERFRYQRLMYISGLIGNYAMGFLIALVYSGIMWAFMQINSFVFPIIFVALLNFLLLILLFLKGETIENQYRMQVFKFYICAVFFIAFLIAFVNYSGLQFFSST